MVLGEVGIHVEHPRVGVAQETETRAPQHSHRCRRLAPGTQAAPDPLIVIEHPGDDLEFNAGAVKSVGNFRHATGRTTGKPAAGVHRFIVERRFRLQIQHQHRHFGLLHNRQDLRTGGVGGRMTDEQIDIFCRQPAARLKGLLRRINHAQADHLGKVGQLGNDMLVILFQLLFQAGKLRPIRRQPHSKETNARLWVIALCKIHTFTFLY